MKNRWDRFWFDFRVSDFHLAAFRLTFFTLFAFDLWLQVKHAPRYGAGEFNVAHLGFLEWLLPSPSRERMLVLYVVQSYLAFLLAFARLPRLWVGILTALFGYSYFISQLDSYQHHWMMLLVLFALSFVHWRPEERRASSIGDWPLRLILAVVSLVYFWAIVTKLDPLWLDGQTVSSQVRHGWARNLVESWLATKSQAPLDPWATMAVLVIAIEGVLALGIHIRWLRLPAAIAGIAFHLGIEAAGFKIGLFSYFMVSIYLLVLPLDDIPRWLSRWFPSLYAQGQEEPLTGPGRVVQGVILILIGVAMFFTYQLGEEGLGAYAVSLAPIALGGHRAFSGRLRSFSFARPVVVVSPVFTGLLLFWLLLFEERLIIALAAFALNVAIAMTVSYEQRKSLRFTLASLLACVALVIVAWGTDTARDYYRFWGGSAQRLGDPETSIQAYSRVIEIDSDYASGHLKLGQLLSKRDPARALEMFERAQKLAPSNAKAFSGAARIHHDAKRGEKAYKAAQEAALLDPKDTAAIRIRDYWRDRR